MPGSVRENDDDVRSFIKENNIKRVLDVGAGKGTYADLIGDLVDTIDAVEVWEPYIENFNLKDKYNRVIDADIRDLDPRVYVNQYDLVVFGDVLEHMSSDESQALWSLVSESGFKYGLISVPIIHYPQGEEFGNPYEVHVQEHMHPEDIRKDYGPFVFDREYEITGTFIKEFNE